jgi:hypothetical protein
VFGVTNDQSGLDSTRTLLDALSATNPTLDPVPNVTYDPDLAALDRHAAAGLISADSGIAYPFTTAQVIAIYRDAVGADPGPETISSALAKLSTANNLNCPL